MNLVEYNKVKELNYLEYCDYLQEKYGIGLADYMTKGFNRQVKCSRTKEGLWAHHKFENLYANLSNKEIAMGLPFEYQLAKNIVYCDFLEHFLLHVLIIENPEYKHVGIGGIVFIAPDLNDFYSGFITNQEWKKKAYELVKDDKEVYLTLIKRFLLGCSKREKKVRLLMVLSSLNADGELWDEKNNEEIYNIIKKI